MAATDFLYQARRRLIAVRKEFQAAKQSIVENYPTGTSLVGRKLSLGGLVQVVERPLNTLEVTGSIPEFSTRRIFIFLQGLLTA